MNLSNEPQVQLLMSVDGIKQVYQRALKAKQIDIICLSDEYESVIGDFFDKEVAPKLYNTSIKTREILPDNKENRDYAKNKDQSKNQIRFMKCAQPSQSDCMLFDSRALLVSFDPKSPFGLVISDKQLVSNLRNQFEVLWEKLKE